MHRPRDCYEIFNAVVHTVTVQVMNNVTMQELPMLLNPQPRRILSPALYSLDKPPYRALLRLAKRDTPYRQCLIRRVSRLKLC